MTTLFEAATVICLRRAPTIPRMSGPIDRILASEAPGLQAGWGDRLFGRNGEIRLRSKRWEVLLTQRPVVNWLRSTEDKMSLMRYGGELSLPGGTRDESDASLAATAERELREELLLDSVSSRSKGRSENPKVKTSIRLHPFNVKVTRAVKGRSYQMHSFVCMADENAWLSSLDLEALNGELRARRTRQLQGAKDGTFWALSHKEKTQMSVEVVEARWMPLRDAILATLRSKCVDAKGGALFFVNEYQQSEYARLALTRRDPMFQTMATLLEVDAVGDDSAALVGGARGHL
jgi:8-oxo-dGTP pyrophosphatase MutT (NUDIX family)